MILKEEIVSLDTNEAQAETRDEARSEGQQQDDRLTFEKALQVVGSFGLYQKRLVVLLCLTCSLVIMQNMSPVFTMRIPKHRCKIPGYTNDSYAIHSEFHRHLVNQTIPVADKGSYSTCTVYVANLNETSSYNRTIRPCSDWVFDKSEFSSTFVTQLNLVCGNKIYRAHSTMAVSVGKFFGALIASVLGDYFGRRRVYTFMMLLLAASAVGLVFPFNLTFLVVLRFLVGFSTTGAYLCVYVIGTELVGVSQRRWFSTAASFSGSLGTFVSVLIAYLTRSGQYFQAGLAVPCIPVIISYFFIPESPRWLASKGRHEEAQNIIDVIARVNGVLKAPPRITIDSSGDSEESKEKAVSPLQLFRIPRLFVRYSLLYLSWMFVAMSIYGLIFNVSNMSGNIFLNYTIMTGMDIASLVLFTCLVDRVGRRPLLTVSSGLGGLACLAAFVPVVLDGNSWILRGLSFFGRLCTSCGFKTLYIMSPELFPTVLRSFGLGSCSMMGRVGTMASPYVADLNILVSGPWGPALPQIVFGVAGVLTAVMTLVQPETKGRNLPETVHQAAEFKRSKICVNDMKVETVLPSTAITKSP